MKAVVVSESREPAFGEVAAPAPLPGQVLLDVDHCGICGSDLHTKTFDIYQVGVVMGHEFSGRVAALGAGVEGWSVGDRVCVNPNGATCGRCAFCLRGQRNLCPEILRNSIGACTNGGMAPSVAVPAVTLHRIPDAMTGAQAAWVEPTAVALRAVRRSGFQAGDSAIVFGAGPIGLLVLEVLKGAGADEVTVVEPNADRRRIAERGGAARAVDPTALDLRTVFPDPADAPAFAFDCVGSAAILQSAISILRPQGAVTVVGMAQSARPFNSQELVLKEIALLGSFIYGDEFDLAIRLIAGGKVDVLQYTSDIRPVDAALTSISELIAGGPAVKILLDARGA